MHARARCVMAMVGRGGAGEKDGVCSFIFRLHLLCCAMKKFAFVRTTQMVNGQMRCDDACCQSFQCAACERDNRKYWSDMKNKYGSSVSAGWAYVGLCILSCLQPSAADVLHGTRAKGVPRTKTCARSKLKDPEMPSLFSSLAGVFPQPAGVFSQQTPSTVPLTIVMDKLRTQQSSGGGRNDAAAQPAAQAAALPAAPASGAAAPQQSSGGGRNDAAAQPAAQAAALPAAPASGAAAPRQSSGGGRNDAAAQPTAEPAAEPALPASGADTSAARREAYRKQGAADKKKREDEDFEKVKAFMAAGGTFNFEEHVNDDANEAAALCSGGGRNDAAAQPAVQAAALPAAPASGAAEPQQSSGGGRNNAAAAAPPPKPALAPSLSDMAPPQVQSRQTSQSSGSAKPSKHQKSESRSASTVPVSQAPVLVVSSSSSSIPSTRGKSGHKGSKAKKKKVRKRDSSSSESSSSSSESSASFNRKRKSKKRTKGKKRAAPFLPDADEENAIFMQLVTNIPFLHSRRGVNAAWKFHLAELHKQGVATECTKQKTFTAWATKQCKDRCAFRLAESRKNGTGQVEPATALDEVMRKWEQAKLAGTSTKNPLAAELMRSACTTTATSLDERTRKIQEAYDKKYRGGHKDAEAAKDAEAESDSAQDKSPTRQRTPTPLPGRMFSPPSSGRGTGAADSRHAFNDAMSKLAQAADSDERLLQQVIAAIQSKQTHIDPPAMDSADQDDLRHALENAGDSYKSLVQHASTIYNALGITSLTQFVHVTETDVSEDK
jgi:hypothetical protein